MHGDKLSTSFFLHYYDSSFHIGFELTRNRVGILTVSMNASPYNELDNVPGALLASKSVYRGLFLREKCVGVFESQDSSRLQGHIAAVRIRYPMTSSIIEPTTFRLVA
jgi:hypothetical protein